MNIKKNLLLALQLFIYCSVYSQTGVCLKGQINNKNERHISFANVVIYLSHDSTIYQGTMTDDNGQFIFENVSMGEYDLKVFFIGYNTKEVSNIAVAEEDLDLGKILIRRKATRLDVITVTSEKGLYEAKAGVTVFNVNGNVNTVGESALELLQNVPSVGIDMDENVTVRGSKATILIDGIESDLSEMLAQIPANAIESIEVMTNPSAKYESKGGAGIVNIKLKEDAKNGYNVAIEGGFGNRENRNLSLIYGRNIKRWRFSGSANFQHNKKESDQLINRFIYTNTETKLLQQDKFDTKMPTNRFIKGGGSYFFEKKSYINLQYIFQDNKQNGYSINNSRNIISDTVVKSINQIERMVDGNSTLHQVKGILKKKFKKEGHSLTVNLILSNSQPTNKTNQINQSKETETLALNKNYKTSLKQNSNQVKLFKTTIDYENPVFKGWNFEAGGLFSHRKFNQEMQTISNSFKWNSMTEEYSENPNEKIRTFEYKGYELSGYTLMSGKINKYAISAGWRFEYTHNESRTDTGRYITLYKFIPSLHIRKKVSDNYNWGASITTRTTPPKYKQLSPISLSTGNYNKNSGNPELKPEIFWQAEWSHHWIKESSNYNFSLFLKNRSDVIGKWYFIEVEVDGEEVSNTKWENLGKIVSCGFDFSSMFSFDKLVIRPNLNSIFFRIIGDKFSPSLDREHLSFNMVIPASYTITKKLTFQLTGKYNSTTITGAGKRFGYGSLDAGVRLKALKNRGLLIFKVMDIFDTVEYDKVINQRVNYVTNSHINPHAFKALINFSYKFNSMANLSKKTGNKNKPKAKRLKI